MGRILAVPLNARLLSSAFAGDGGPDPPTPAGSAIWLSAGLRAVARWRLVLSPLFHTNGGLTRAADSPTVAASSIWRAAAPPTGWLGQRLLVAAGAWPPH
jgi:hypothetical protein